MVPDCDLNNPAANGECAALDNQNLGRPVVHSQLRSELRLWVGHAAYNWSMGFGVAARSASARLRDRDVQSQLVGQLVRRGQPVYCSPPITRHMRSTRRAIRDCRMEEAIRIDGLYNLVPTKVGQVDELAQSYKNFW
jgi:hypothetical protein